MASVYILDENDKSDLQGQINNIVNIKIRDINNTIKNNKAASDQAHDDLDRELETVEGNLTKKIEDDDKALSDKIDGVETALSVKINGNTDSIRSHAETIEANKSELDGKIADEIKNRENADKAENERAIGVEKDLDERLKTVENDVNTFLESADLTEAAKDTLREIQDYIDSDVEAAATMTANIQANATNISNLDTTLRGVINTTVGEEKTRAEGVESTLSAAITAEQTRATGVESGLNDRLTTAEEGINSLRSTVDSNKNDLHGKIDTNQTELLSILSTNRQELQTSINANASNIAANTDGIAENKSNISSLTTQMQSGDDTLQSNINSLRSDLQSNINTLITDISDLQSGDIQLQTNIGSISNDLLAHKSDTSAHADIRDSVDDLSDQVSALIGVTAEEATLEQLTQMVEYIRANQELINSVTTAKVSVEDIADDLVTNVPDKVLSANQGVILNNLILNLSNAVADLTARVEVLERKTSTPVFTDDGEGNVTLSFA